MRYLLTPWSFRQRAEGGPPENPFLRAVVKDRRSLEDAIVRRLQDRLTDADIELIVMGTHGCAGLACVVLGSVAQAWRAQRPARC